jgi:DNA-nicking Smr family endonuclease
MKKYRNLCRIKLHEPPVPSPEDKELFRANLTDVTPITPHGRIVPPPTRLPPIPLSLLRDEREVIFESLHDPIRWDEDAETGEELSFVRPGISRQILRRLRRGEWVSQAELDLHGLIRVEAKIELVNFLFECKRRSIRCVRIIHGKGLGSKNREPVLKNHVRHWLMQRDEIMAFVQARPVDGGGGAVMVLLKSNTRN